jgi:hypothetical protein
MLISSTSSMWEGMKDAMIQKLRTGLEKLSFEYEKQHTLLEALDDTVYSVTGKRAETPETHCTELALTFRQEAEELALPQPPA